MQSPAEVCLTLLISLPGLQDDVADDIKPDAKRPKRDPPSHGGVDANGGPPPNSADADRSALPRRVKSFEFCAPAAAGTDATAAAAPHTAQHANGLPPANGAVAGRKQHGVDLNGAELGGDRMFGASGRQPPSPAAAAAGPTGSETLALLQVSPRSAFSPTAAAARAGSRLLDNLSPFTAMAADGAADQQGSAGATADGSPPHRGTVTAMTGHRDSGGLGSSGNNISTIASLHSWGAAANAAASPPSPTAAEDAAVALLSSRMRSPASAPEPPAARHAFLCCSEMMTARAMLWCRQSSIVLSEALGVLSGSHTNHDDDHALPRHRRHSPSLPQRASPRAGQHSPKPQPDVALASALQRRHDPGDLSPLLAATADGSPGPPRPSVRRLSDPQAAFQACSCALEAFCTVLLTPPPEPMRRTPITRTSP